jgi:hypothetical protein
LKAGPQKARRLLLALTVAGSALALAGSQLKPVNEVAGVGLAVVAAVAMAAVGLLGGQRSAEQVRRWTRARSVSEAIKNEVFLFLASVDRYSGPDAGQRLDAEVQRLESGDSELLAWAQGLKPASRSLPAVHDLETYLEVRVRGSQLNGFYEPKAELMWRRLRALKRTGVVLALAAAALAALTSVAPHVGAWAAVVSTATGAVAAFAASEHYEMLWVEYRRTAEELRRLVERRTAVDGSALSDSQLVARCEEVIALQNQTWMAKWGKESKAAAGS